MGGESVNLSANRTYRAVLRRLVRVITFPDARSAHLDDPPTGHLYETLAPGWRTRRRRRIVATETSDLDQQSLTASRSEFDDARPIRTRADDLVHPTASDR